MNARTNGPPTTACGVATQLLAAYRAALDAYDKVQGAAFQNLVQEHITMREAAHARDAAHRAMIRARKAYWRHVDEHAAGG